MFFVRPLLCSNRILTKVENREAIEINLHINTIKYTRNTKLVSLSQLKCDPVEVSPNHSAIKCIVA